MLKKNKQIETCTRAWMVGSDHGQDQNQNQVGDVLLPQTMAMAMAMARARARARARQGAKVQVQGTRPLHYNLETYRRSNQDTCLVHKPALNTGEWVEAGDLLADSSASKNGELALGKNILVAYMPWEGYNYEDAILINERLVYDDAYTSVHIERYEIETKESQFISSDSERITRDIPDLRPDQLAHLDTNGIARIGSWIEEGDILVGKVTPINPKKQTGYQKFILKLFERKANTVRDSSLRAPKGIKANVISVQILGYSHLLMDEKPLKTKSQVASKENFKQEGLPGHGPGRGYLKTAAAEKQGSIYVTPSSKNEKANMLKHAKKPKGSNTNTVFSVKGFVQYDTNQPHGSNVKSKWLSQDKRTGLKNLLKPLSKLSLMQPSNRQQTSVYLSRILKIFDINDKGIQCLSPKLAERVQGNNNILFNKATYVTTWSVPTIQSRPIRKNEQSKTTVISYNNAYATKKSLIGTCKLAPARSGCTMQTPAKAQVQGIRHTFSQFEQNKLQNSKVALKCVFRDSINVAPRLKNALGNIVQPLSKEITVSHKMPNKPLNLDKANTNKNLQSNGIIPTNVHLYLAEKRKIQVGDKMAGRHGNKGIISNILPRQDMPYLPDGTALDIVLNPLGVPSRMNVGQIYECLLGLAGKYLGEHYKIYPFDEMYGAEASRSFVFSKLFEASKKTGIEWLFDPNSPGKIRIFDGRNAECFDQPVTVGIAYMLKLVHMVDDKIHARSTGPYSLVTQQPLRGRAKQGGQRLGEMEVWAIEGYGAAFVLLEMLTLKSDDMTGRLKLWSDLILNKDITLGTPESFKVLVCELQALCLDIGLFRGNREIVRTTKLDLQTSKNQLGSAWPWPGSCMVGPEHGQAGSASTTKEHKQDSSKPVKTFQLKEITNLMFLP